MASVTLQISDRIQSGTVTVYPASNWPATVPPSGSPVGSSTTSASVGSDGTVTFTGLSENTDYYAYQATPDRYVRFRVDSPVGSSAEPEVTDSGSAVRTPKGNYQGTVSSTAVTLATIIGTSIPSGSKFALVSFSNAVRYRDDGTNPTASVGFPIAASTPWKFDESDLTTVKFIRQSADATVDVAFYA